MAPEHYCVFASLEPKFFVPGAGGKILMAKKTNKNCNQFKYSKEEQ